MKTKIRILNLIARIGLFTLILILGTMAALMVGETEGLALADLSSASVRAVATATHGDVLYAALIGGPRPAGIYRSDDNGYTWRLVSSGPVAVKALAVHSANEAVIYAGTAGGPAATTDNLWRSDDGGQTWRKFVMSLPANPDGVLLPVNALATDPNQPGMLYVGTDGHGVYRVEDDDGRNAYKLVGGLSLYDAHVNGLVVAPDRRMYALTSHGLFVTDGSAWQKLSLPELAASLAVAPDDPQTLYAGCVSTGAYRTTDGGQTWEPINNGLEMIPGAALRVTALTVDEEDPNRVVASIAYGVGGQLVPWGIYESQDAGRSWTKLAEADAVVMQLTINQGVISAVKANGLARYGEPIRPAPVISLPNFHSLTNPSGIQVLILILTIGLAGLTLVGQTEWVLRR
ncbi:MAG: hypothetical protein OEW09_15300, partial [Anaerolineae bacterium]|nr:hypothetical protein [Anaerolineae bacterium]